jgi:hypothetical protein
LVSIVIDQSLQAIRMLVVSALPSAEPNGGFVLLFRKNLKCVLPSSAGNEMKILQQNDNNMSSVVKARRSGGMNSSKAPG